MYGVIQVPSGALPERSWPERALLQTILYALACTEIADASATVLTVADRRACAG